LSPDICTTLQPCARKFDTNRYRAYYGMTLRFFWSLEIIYNIIDENSRSISECAVTPDFSMEIRWQTIGPTGAGHLRSLDYERPTDAWQPKAPPFLCFGWVDPRNRPFYCLNFRYSYCCCKSDRMASSRAK